MTQTPAQKAGIVMGKKYAVHSPQCGHTHGGVYVLSRDDGTTLPFFDLAEGFKGPQDASACVYVDGTGGAILTEVGGDLERAMSYKIDVSDTGTVVSTSQKLSFDQIKAIMDILGAA